MEKINIQYPLFCLKNTLSWHQKKTPLNVSTNISFSLTKSIRCNSKFQIMSIDNRLSHYKARGLSKQTLQEKREGKNRKWICSYVLHNQKWNLTAVIDKPFIFTKHFQSYRILTIQSLTHNFFPSNFKEISMILIDWLMRFGGHLTTKWLWEKNQETITRKTITRKLSCVHTADFLK